MNYFHPELNAWAVAFDAIMVKRIRNLPWPDGKSTAELRDRIRDSVFNLTYRRIEAIPSPADAETICGNFTDRDMVELALVGLHTNSKNHTTLTKLLNALPPDQPANPLPHKPTLCRDTLARDILIAAISQGDPFNAATDRAEWAVLQADKLLLALATPT